jgi:hypothetical protein
MLYWSHFVPTALSGFQTTRTTAAVVRPSRATMWLTPIG